MESSSLMPKRKLPVLTRLSYGVGHVMNDLCASMWFTYLLIFYHRIIGLDNIRAGNLLLLGQVADAIATPFIGVESDRISGFCGYGKRKSWHVIGSICVAASFAFIFMPIIGVDADHWDINLDPNISWYDFIYYAPFIIIFQFGWAAVQISHLALIPELTSCEHDRVELNAIRYGFTVISNVAVYGIAWGLLDEDMRNGPDNDDLQPKDFYIFRILVLIVLGVGTVFTIIFHVGTREHTTEERIIYEASLSSSVRLRMGAWCWLKTPQFYVVGVLYMCTRLIVNMSQVYLTMYLTETLDLAKSYIGIVPLIIYVCGFASTFPMKYLSRKIGKKVVLTVGLVLVVGSSIWYQFLQQDITVDSYMVMVASALGGIGGTTISVISLALLADLISDNTESGAFVYGAMSFADKLANGVAVQLIQIFHPCKSSACCDSCSPYYRSIMVYVPAGFCVLAFVALLCVRRRHTQYESLPINADDNASEDLRTHRPASYGSTEDAYRKLSSEGVLDDASPRSRAASSVTDHTPSFTVGSSLSPNV